MPWAAGVGDRLYMAYETGGGLYFRTWQSGVLSNYLQLETVGAWPSITQAPDGQAWLMWENGGSLLMRHYDGANWEPATTLLTATSFDKGFYPNLRLRPDTGQVEWVSTSCRGGPFSVVYGNLAVNPVNDLPTISDIGDLTIDEDGNTGPLNFTVGDTETPAVDLIVTGSPSNIALVPAANIVFGGSGIDRTVTVTPAANQFGTATITVTATDVNGGAASDTFVLTVNSVNDAPVAVDDRYDTAGDTVLTLTQADLKGNDADVDNTNAQLSVTAVSNPMSGAVVLNGDGTITFTPAAGFSGTAGLDYTVSDGSLTDTAMSLST